jgi:solute:Na+ symporter, SSS family
VRFNWIDGLAFLGFILAVIIISLRASRKQETAEGYFLAGRGLTWWLIGFSLLASNISTEHFVGMAGAGYGAAGLAIASWEYAAAIALVFVAIFLLPVFLRLGIFTMPEFLEHRYGAAARSLMAVYLMTAYIGVLLASILYSGALALQTIFGLPLVVGVWMIGLIAGIYTIYGGLKAVVWSDLLQGATLLLGGAMVFFLALSKVGGWNSFVEHNQDRLHLLPSADHPTMPWTVLLLGIWIPSFYYWGCNQFITQRTLAARSLAAGQRGILFAAWLKLLIPIIVVLPGIMAYQLYQDQITSGDQAYAVLISQIVPVGLRGILLAALFGAVLSSLDSLLNSSSTLFTMDFYRRFWRPDADTVQLVRTGRWATAVFVLLGCLVAPLPGQFEGVFFYMKMIMGFISPGIVTVFLVGFLFRRASLAAALTVMFLGIPVYGLLLWQLPDWAFLNQMAVTFLILAAVMGLMTLWKPLPAPVRFEPRATVDLTPCPYVKYWGAALIVVVLLIYIWFR